MNRLNLIKRSKTQSLRIKDLRKQKVITLRAYLKKQRSLIFQNTRRRMIRTIGWVVIGSVSCYFLLQLLSQKFEMKQIQAKLISLYPSIVSQMSTQNIRCVFYVRPEYDDQLANIIEMCWKYHIKVIISNQFNSIKINDPALQKFLLEIPEAIRSKCLIVSLQKMKNHDFDLVNGRLKVESGITIKQLNQVLIKAGFQPIFPREIADNSNQTVYDAISNNYPTRKGPITNYIANFELISPQGSYFRSSNQNNQYGSTPNLNNIFLGSGCIFGLPFRVNFKLTFLTQNQQQNHFFVMNSIDISQKLLMTRKIRSILQSRNDLKFQVLNGKNDKIFLKLKTNQSNRIFLGRLKQQLKKQLPDLNQLDISENNFVRNNFNIFFNVSQHGFEKFLVYQQNNAKLKLDFSYSENLLKVSCQDKNVITEMTNEICSQNGVIVWCKQNHLMRQLKKLNIESQIGAELIRYLVQMREGIDRKKIFYSHNTQEDYLSKGFFRKLTQIFW